MSKPIYQLVNDLPAKSMTTRALGALDWVIPGQWENLVGWENTIKKVTGEDDPALIQKIGDRAIRLFNDRSQGYQRALWLYQTVDTGQGAMGMLAMTNLIGEKINFLSFLNKITPKSEKVQTVDLAVKLVVELVAFTKINGIPGDGIADFVRALGDYGHESLMRMAALACFDGVLPLGPEFMSKTLGLIQGFTGSDVSGSGRFQQVASMIPGADANAKLGFMRQSLGAVSGWMTKFVSDKAITADKVVGSLKGWIDFSEGKLDLLAALLDMGCNYYEHTGIQTLARRLISRAVAEI